MVRFFTFMLIATVTVLLGACFGRDNPFDQDRCEKGCSGGLVCYEAVCVQPDSGVADDGAPPVSDNGASDSGKDISGKDISGKDTSGKDISATDGVVADEAVPDLPISDLPISDSIVSDLIASDMAPGTGKIKGAVSVGPLVVCGTDPSDDCIGELYITVIPCEPGPNCRQPFVVDLISWEDLSGGKTFEYEFNSIPAGDFWITTFMFEELSTPDGPPPDYCGQATPVTVQAGDTVIADLVLDSNCDIGP